ncbi:hypothetical protein [Tenacibaculum sp. C7A-26P2]|uniref:hypothetical protein n=1 Tax=Tenacibaculum sp. C7A-26P2 TaxID=3447504 RepID=UPI003F87DD48
MKKVFFFTLLMLLFLGVSCTPPELSEDSEINPVAIDKDKVEPTKPPQGNN